MRKRECFLYAVFLLIFTVFGGADVWGAKKDKKKSSDSEFNVAWTAPVSLQFQDIPLVDLLTMEAEANRFAFFLDRRVDPQTPITYEAEGKPLITVLSEIADANRLDLICKGNLLYIGPPQSGGELLLLWAIHRQGNLNHSNPKKDALQKQIGLNEEEFFDPAQILKKTASDLDLRWSGLDKMPFDYWRGLSLPSLTSSELFSLFLIGFGVDFGLDENKPVLKPVSLPRQEEMARSWPTSEMAAVRREDFPRVTWSELRNETRAAGPFDEIAAIEYLAFQERVREAVRRGEGEEKTQESARLSSRQRQNAGKEGGRFVSGEFKQGTLRTLFEELAKSFEMEFILDPSLDSLGISEETRISCQFKNANPKQAAKMIAQELKVSYRITDNQVIFYQKEKER